MDISIHAPTWGATIYGELLDLRAAISIHAPTWGATSSGGGTGTDGRISIHAPTWGATLPEGAVVGTVQFQSTHPHGVRPCQPTLSVLVSIPYFNPRTHMGCDKFLAHLVAKVVNFNPRTHMGCDEHIPTYGGKLVEFQSTHPHGVRHLAER